MNGSRSTPSRPAGSSSLDALSRTIEGLEARIEGLMVGTARDSRPAEEPRREAPRERDGRGERELRADPLAEIRQRQRALEASRPRAAERAYRDTPSDILARSAAPMTAPTAAAKPYPAAAQAPSDLVLKDITQALLSLRQDLKQDISESLAREVSALRSEIHGIRTIAEDHPLHADMREDLARIASGITELGQNAAPGSDRLRAEFDDLRSLMDGLAREDSVRHMENRWSTLETKLQRLDTDALQEELVSLAYRLDDIKKQLGTMGDARSVRALEDKLMAVATALEHIGSHIEPNERAMNDQFAGIDLRLDEITRAIAAGGRSSASSVDMDLIARLEDRIGAIARQIETMAINAAARPDPASELGSRIEALSARIEELSSEQAASKLEERLDHLSLLLERSQKPVAQPELTGYLADISRKIDALDHGAVNDRLAERLEILGRRIEDIELPQAAPAMDDRLLRSLDDRLHSIAIRLEETTAAPLGDQASLSSLEEQIAHLSALISNTPIAGGPQTEQFEGRMAALEDYLSTSDEYIIEAARQAAEAVMDNYARQQGQSHGVEASQGLETMAALADHLKHLEEISRGTEERTHRTFEALHETLVQIAEKLDQMDQRTAAPAPAFARPEAIMAASVERDMDAAAASHLSTVRRELEAAFQSPETQQTPPAADNRGTASDSVAPVEAQAAADKKPGRPSLLAGLGKRLIPGPKKDEPTATKKRDMIDPSPSIDPADMLPPEEANELLEPGSGTPDVRKILERVRASQNAARAGTSGTATTGADDRADYIAAARRAAQAAAQETDRSQRSPMAKLADEVNAGSTFKRYRRPILMAVGAVLLAAMALPLVNTLTRGEKAPDAAIEAIEPPESSQAPGPAGALPSGPTADTMSAETAPATTDDLSVPPALEENVAPAEQPAVDESAPIEAAPVAPVERPSASLDNAPMDGGSDVDTLAPAGTVAEPDGLAPPATAMAPESAPATATIEIPEGITPPSLTAAAKAGDPLALFEIGARFTEGRGVANDLSKAAVWYQHAADRGFAPAQYRLANLYEKGTGVERDIAKAKALYQQAADAGNASAMHNLAVLYASGADGTPDFAKAAEWFTRAAELGVSDSQFNLAVLFARGNGVSQDLEASYKWFAIAAKDGDKDAAKKRDEVANAMPAERLEQARATVDLWKAKPLNADANAVDVPDEWAGKGLKTASVDMDKAIRNIQAILNNNGFDAGTPDGKLGKKTITAIKAFQTSIGQEPTGRINDQLVTALLARNK
ncbi:peptidoglycan-binding protein [Agrobacterium sp. a22-2]|uniref:peptidoglycan-binding protein n=1 Tax=Agrobacterium sp. a22-2 TaxID=2283840 RepID=UPI0014455202|nr:peptidoglycan-binding protein [Agrobacterium sp. a22-2]NKN34934.1 peptidoglycan-binding protein [Agrobacterium sp. a22-2]